MFHASVYGILSLLDENEAKIKTFALEKLIEVVDEFWLEISERIEKIENIYADFCFTDRHLAALLASKIYYHLGLFNNAVNYALRAGYLFDREVQSEYKETIIGKSINFYALRRQKRCDVCPYLKSVVDRMLQISHSNGTEKEALSFAIDTFRTDYFEEQMNMEQSESYIMFALEIIANFVANQRYKHFLLDIMANKCLELRSIYYEYICRCSIMLQNFKLLGKYFWKMHREGNELLMYQMAFDLNQSCSRNFLKSLSKELKQINRRYFRTVRLILKGNVTFHFFHQFCLLVPFDNHRAKMTIKEIVQFTSGSVCYYATVIANSFLYLGNSTDQHVHNEKWFHKSANWARFTAFASLGVLHKWHEREVVKLLTKDFSILNAVPEYSGATVFCAGLIEGNHGKNVSAQILNHSQKVNDYFDYGSCLSIGLTSIGTWKKKLSKHLLERLFSDDAVEGEAAAIGLGLVMMGSSDVDLFNKLVSYTEETKHEKISQGIAVGLGLILFGKESKVNHLVELLRSKNDHMLRKAAMYMIGMAYCGTDDSSSVSKLLQAASSDAHDEVRQAAVISLAFVLFKSHEKSISIISMLIESYNPHVRYGAAIALGIMCVGSGLKEATDILESVIRSDRVSLVRQGALIASGFILIQQTDNTCPSTSQFRSKYSEIIKSKYEDDVTKFGAIIAQGIIDAGGRRLKISLLNPLGFTSMTAVAGIFLFTQYGSWYPLSLCLSLAFTPACLIALNSDLRMLKLNYVSNAEPGFYTYIPQEEDEEKMEEHEVAFLSLNRKQRKQLLEVKQNEETKTISSNPLTYEILNNPASVTQQQLAVVNLQDYSYIPMKDLTLGGIIMMETSDVGGEEEFVLDVTTEELVIPDNIENVQEYIDEVTSNDLNVS